EMEHLDLAGYLAHTSTTCNSLETIQHHDATCLSSSRQILEPIIEETSEDEEQAPGSWNKQRSKFSNLTESDSAFFNRIEVTKDSDTISERDFACPPKRARRCQELEQRECFDESVQLRRSGYNSEQRNSLERFLSLESNTRDSFGSQVQRNSTGSRRCGVFEDYFSDNDSYQSLSRSSSLVQFESLERQLTLQEQNQTMIILGNSSPSLLNCEQGSVTGLCDGNLERRRASSSTLSLLKRYESSDGRLHQNYHELNKLNYEDQHKRKLLSNNLPHQELKSDSESSSSSSDASGRSQITSIQSNKARVTSSLSDSVSRRKLPNSAENLSEDSGYCEPGIIWREISKSIPLNLDKMCEEGELQLFDIEHSASSFRNSFIGYNLCRPKIVQKKHLAEMHCSPSASINSMAERIVFSGSSTSASTSSLPFPSPNESAASTSSTASFTWLYNSLPEVREPRGPSSVVSVNVDPQAPHKANGYVLATNNIKSSNSSNCRRSRSNSPTDCFSILSASTQSLPNLLQELECQRRFKEKQTSQWNCHNISRADNTREEWETVKRGDFFGNNCSLPKISRSHSWNERGEGILHRADRRFEKDIISVAYLNASYQNLTLLDYTNEQPTAEQLQWNLKRTKSIKMSDRKSLSDGDYEQIICKDNFLLDEISQIYDKNVSILNDKPFERTNKVPELILGDSYPPYDAAPVQHVQLTVRKPPPRAKRLSGNPEHNPKIDENVKASLAFGSVGKTFDQDPTNLRTSYAQSLEQCNFDVQKGTIDKSHIIESQSLLPMRRFQSQTAAAKPRSLVCSTPDLSAIDIRKQDPEKDIYISSAHTSMHQLSQIGSQVKPLGILLPAGSRNSFGKEVSFCPVVSKYCWQEQFSDEPGNSSEEEMNHSSDDELLDNMDATVVNNTKENENIAARYHEEKMEHERGFLREPKAPISIEECDEKNENIVSIEHQQTERNTDLEVNQQYELVLDGLEKRAIKQPPTPSVCSGIISSPPRSVSLHLPILSEPPTNRAHHILYASQQLLQRYVPETSASVCEMLPRNNSKQDAMPSERIDERQNNSRSFLSRFAHGLRFSLRRKKKHQPLDRIGTEQKLVSSKKTSPGPLNRTIGNDNVTKSSNSFMHIPLNLPTDSRSLQSIATEPSSDSIHCDRKKLKKLDKNFTLQKGVTGKPPLPRQAPRNFSIEHVSYCAVASGACETTLATDMRQYQNLPHLLTSGNQTAKMLDSENPSRATECEKMLMFNHSGVNDHGVKPTMFTAVPVAVSPNAPNEIGFIETNLDTDETVISGKTRSLIDITSKPLSLPHRRYVMKPLKVTSVSYEVDDLEGDSVKMSLAGGGVQIASVRRPHKSMEFLLDKENKRNALPPENELKKSHDHNPTALSEHQLRVQASLQRLNIPDWFRQFNQGDKSAAEGNPVTSNYRPGNITRKRTQELGRWQGLNSKTTSLSSLGSHPSDRSPLLLSPSAHSHHGGQSIRASGSTTEHSSTGESSTRWSTSQLNTQTSPIISQRGSFTRGAPITSSFISVASSSGVLRNSYRQPYLGWRSTEKLSHRTPHERLANSLLAQRTNSSPTSVTNDVPNFPAEANEIQSSIKEVTSAIVHYVNDQQQLQQQRSRSNSPNSRKCWLESSFVGIRPLDSPLTPMIDTSHPSSAHGNHNQYYNPHHLHLTGSSSPVVNLELPPHMNGLSRVDGGGAPERSQSSASLEDVLASLLGLPTAFAAIQKNNHNKNISKTEATAKREHLKVLPAADQQKLRRRSEGDAPQTNEQPSQTLSHSKTYSNKVGNTSHTITCSQSRRVSLRDFVPIQHDKKREGQTNDDQETLIGLGILIRCRNTKCEQYATPPEAKKLYKSCHNCSYLYCSRECRRAHWEKHRKACLHSRVSNLCRQVLAKCKDDLDSQRQLSLLARKGSISQGRGVVRVLFRSSDAAECFIKNGFQCIGEASYVRWPDLMPAEMGLELYSELLKLSTEYKPESKMLIYVAICVVSEAPGMGQAPVRWERQLVSRCAKLKLCKTALAELELQQHALHQSKSVVSVPERTEILILTFNPSHRSLIGNRELILSNIINILSRRGVLLRMHYPEIFQRLQTFTEGHSDKFIPVTLNPRDSKTGQNFVCIIMPVHTDGEFIQLPSAADGGNCVTTVDVGSPAALAQLDDDDLLMQTMSVS
ncbi:hypothetical protein KR018_004039, partial [Drosophila ironensis]